MNPAVSAWIDQLNEGSWVGRTQAAESLGKIGSPQAIKALEDLFVNYHFMSRHDHACNDFYFTTALVLAELDHFHAFRIVVDEDAPFVRSRVVTVLKRVGRDRSIDAAIRMLGSSNPGERYWAGEVLYVLNAVRASDALLKAQHKEAVWDIRLALLRALITCADEAAVPTLEALLLDQHRSIRQLAQMALEKLRTAGT